MASHEERRAATRRKILRAASALFMEHGFNHTTINQVVDKANIVKGTFYQHFRSKKELLVALRRHDGAERVSALIAEVDQGRSPMDALCGYYLVLAQWFETIPKLAEDVIVSAIRLHDPNSNQPEYMAHDFTKLMLETARKRGEIRKDISTNSQALVISGAITLAVIDWSRQPKHSRLQQVVDECMQLSLNGILLKQKLISGH